MQSSAFGHLRVGFLGLQPTERSKLSENSEFNAYSMCLRECLCNMYVFEWVIHLGIISLWKLRDEVVGVGSHAS